MFRKVLVVPLRLTILGRIVIFLVLTQTIDCQLKAKHIASNVWLQRPGKVNVCEGGSTSFRWTYNASMGNFESLFLVKNPPDWKDLIAKQRSQAPTRYDDRADVIINNHTFVFTLNQTRQSDNGIYEIQLNLDNPTNHLYDDLKLEVLPLTVCPDRYQYHSPLLYLTQKPGDAIVERVYNNQVINLTAPGKLQLLVKVPPADPPVNCMIASDRLKQNCSGAKDREMDCKVDFFFSNRQEENIAVKFTFIAFEHSITTFSVVVKDWLHRPGLVNVCQEDSVLFNWTYFYGIGDFQYLYLLKNPPDWRDLIEIHAGQAPIRHDARADVIIYNRTFAFTLKQSVLSDSGIYELQLNLDNPAKQLYDELNINVIPKAVCPDRLKFLSPMIYITRIFGEEVILPVKNRQLIELGKPGNILLVVKVPSADPPVNCTIATGHLQQICIGATDKDTDCEVDMFLSKGKHQDVIVQLTFVALENSITIFSVSVEACPKPELFNNPIIAYRQMTSNFSRIHNKSVELSEPGQITLLVVIPPANPPVRCTITADKLQHSCSGNADINSQCELELAISRQQYIEVNLTWNVIECKPFTNQIDVQFKGEDPETILSRNVQPDFTLLSSTNRDVREIWPLLLIIVIILTLGALFVIGAVYRSRRWKGKRLSYSHNKLPGNTDDDVESSTLLHDRYPTPDEGKKRVMSDNSQKNRATSAGQTHGTPSDRATHGTTNEGEGFGAPSYVEIDRARIKGEIHDKPTESETHGPTVEGEMDDAATGWETHSTQIIGETHGAPIIGETQGTPTESNTYSTTVEGEPRERATESESLETQTDNASYGRTAGEVEMHGAQIDRETCGIPTLNGTLGTPTEGEIHITRTEEESRGQTAQSENIGPIAEGTTHGRHIAGEPLGTTAGIETYGITAEGERDGTANEGERHSTQAEGETQNPMEEGETRDTTREGEMNGQAAEEETRVNYQVNNQLDGNSPLHIAAYNGHLDFITHLCSNGVDMHTLDVYGRTPLGVASFQGNINVVEYLIAHGSDVNYPGNDGNPPIHSAALHGHLTVIQCLRGNGADLTALDTNGHSPLDVACLSGQLKVVEYITEQGYYQPSDGVSSIHLAGQEGHLDIVRFLCDKGADLNLLSKDGRTALGTAALNGHLNIVKFLLDQGPDIDYPRSDGNPPLLSAAFNGYLDVVDYLQGKGANLQIFDREGRSALGNASLNGHLRVVEYLCKLNCDIIFPEETDNPPLHLAAENGHLRVVRYLKRKGANIQTLDKHRRSPLGMASLEGHMHVVKYLIAEGSSVNHPGTDGYSPLHCAAFKGHLDITKYLLQTGASVQTLNIQRMSPLGSASLNGHINVVEYLVQQGSKVNGQRNGALAPLHCAAREGYIEVVDYLCSHGADLKYYDDHSISALGAAAYNGHIKVVEYLTERGSIINYQAGKFVPPLHCAAKQGHLDVVKYLQRKGANLQQLDNECRTPLSSSSEGGHVRVVAYLIEQGADINHPRANGYPPVHCAALGGHLDIIKLLCSKGSNLKTKDILGRTALDIACSSRLLPIVEYLTQQKSDANHRGTNTYSFSAAQLNEFGPN